MRIADGGFNWMGIPKFMDCPFFPHIFSGYPIHMLIMLYFLEMKL